MATTITAKLVDDHVRAGRLADLFIESLGWDHPTVGAVPPIEVVPTSASVEPGETPPPPATYRLDPVAEKRGVVVFACAPDQDGRVPDSRTRAAIESRLVATAHLHLIVFHDLPWQNQVWQWTVRERGQPVRTRDVTLAPGRSAEDLAQRLNAITFTLDEEESVTLTEVVARVGGAFDKDRVTKKFYDRFSKERSAFEAFITGFEDAAGDGQTARAWYASLMLNRLMFVYFIQQKRFLAGDQRYLQNRLDKVRAGALGPDPDGTGFLTFYRAFLRRLFHDGLNTPERDRDLDPALAALLGDVPYLNGGFFDVHDLERDHAGIDIPDGAFDRLFAFFTEYQWHLDDRPLKAGNEINPDVLGYIFEKFINQKETGAYYTKEDITGYICQNTILPWVLDEARRRCAVAFDPAEDGNVWRHLQANPDRYIYPAVRHGVIDEAGEVLPLPDEIAAGVDDVSRRTGWNRRVDGPHGLPTETWREHVHRRQRCLDLRERLRDGAVTSADDLITLNLDIRQFAQDVVELGEGPELLRAMYRAVRDVTVLDPTCGSGAFLFAALNVLEPLHEACLRRMRGFVADLDRERATATSPKKYEDFRAAVDGADAHPNWKYHVLRQIVLTNLYGVDIMPEAVEICKLRLFLTLVAHLDDAHQIEPLPDIDFNIRAGNSLVGFARQEDVRRAMLTSRGHTQMRMEMPADTAALARITERAGLADRAFAHFKQIQNVPSHDNADLRHAKRDYRDRLGALREELDLFLADQYGVLTASHKHMATWKTSHQPFHWFADVYGVVQSNGGFDAVVGNPPYIAMSKVRKVYGPLDFETERCTDVYAMVMERTASLLRPGGRSGMIVPLSLTFSGDFNTLRRLLEARYATSWFSSFARIPGALFAHDVRVRNTIHLGRKGKSSATAWTTVIHRWFEEARPHLLENLEYAAFTWGVFGGLVPKFNTTRLGERWTALDREQGGALRLVAASKPTNWPLHFRSTAYNSLSFTPDQPPVYDAGGQIISQTQYDALFVADQLSHRTTLAVLNGKYAFTYWCVTGDDFHVTKGQMLNLPFSPTALSGQVSDRLTVFANELEVALEGSIAFKLNAGKHIGSYNMTRNRSITDKSGAVLARVLGLEEVWDDIELMCAQVVKTGFDVVE